MNGTWLFAAAGTALVAALAGAAIASRDLEDPRHLVSESAATVSAHLPAMRDFAAAASAAARDLSGEDAGHWRGDAESIEQAAASVERVARQLEAQRLLLTGTYRGTADPAFMRSTGEALLVEAEALAAHGSLMTEHARAMSTLPGADAGARRTITTELGRSGAAMSEAALAARRAGLSLRASGEQLLRSVGR